MAAFHYPNFSVAEWNAGTLRDRYDVVRVNRNSLKSYLSWVLTKTYKISPSKREDYARHAQFVLKIADHFDGLFPQRKILSDFGRTYYAGISIQNVNKVLRRAIIAPACEYDINTSVCAWKLGIAYENITTGNREQSVKKKHLALYQYVKGKKEFIDSIRIYVFPGSEKKEHENQRKLIKNALTALSFGATLKTKGWADPSGSRRYPAISSIFGKDTEAANRFIANHFVADFTKDHEQIDAGLYSLFQNDVLPEHVPSYLKTKSGRVSRSKVIAWMYQHAETEMMDELRAFISDKTSRTVLASIHDAIILDRPLIASAKLDLIYHLQTRQNNPFITLKKNELLPFANASPDEEVIEALYD